MAPYLPHTGSIKAQPQVKPKDEYEYMKYLLGHQDRKNRHTGHLLSGMIPLVKSTVPIDYSDFIGDSPETLTMEAPTGQVSVSFMPGGAWLRGLPGWNRIGRILLFAD